MLTIVMIVIVLEIELLFGLVERLCVVLVKMELSFERVVRL